jgi:hypothetical protein
MKLAAIQKRMARAVMTPLAPGDNMQRRVSGMGDMSRYAATFIKPNDRLTSFERLELYNRQYWWRVLAALQEDFPGLRAVLGDKKFDAMSKAYLVDCPSTSFTLRNLGRKLEGWLTKHPQWAGKNQRLALDIARLEMADIEAFDGKTEPALKPENISALAGGSLKLRLQPYIQLLDCNYPVDDLLLAVRDSDEGAAFASNAFSQRRKRRRVRAAAKLKPAEIFLAVHRIDESVYFRRLAREEFLILRALRDGKSLAQAIDLGFRSSKAPIAVRAETVQKWFQHWATLGWFCKRAQKAASA